MNSFSFSQLKSTCGTERMNHPLSNVYVMMGDFEKGQHLETVQAVFEKMFRIVVQGFRIPETPAGSFAGPVNQLVVVIHDVIRHGADLTNDAVVAQQGSIG
jgi:hypothetical protein